MPEVTYRLVESPHDYFPHLPNRTVLRLQAHADGIPAGYIDYFIEDDWTFFFAIYARPEHRQTGLAERMTIDIATLYMTTERGVVFANTQYLSIYEKLIAATPGTTWVWPQMMRIDWADDDPLRPVT